MGKLSFNIDKKQVTEHEHVTVSWDCENPEQVTLTVEDGTKSIHQLPDSGSRVIEASGNADRMTLTLRAVIGGKTQEKSVTVKVKRKVLKAEKVHGAPRGSSGSRKAWFDFSKVKGWWSRTIAGLKTSWTYMPENKKLATKILGLMCAVMLLTGFVPKLFPVGLIAIIGYLTWIIVKR
ncbi:MAG: hypothetical protein IJ753_04450 [Bacteroidales bacterium]|nr:hypothetical protein [Bacteroidales bacterium]